MTDKEMIETIFILCVLAGNTGLAVATLFERGWGVAILVSAISFPLIVVGIASL